MSLPPQAAARSAVGDGRRLRGRAALVVAILVVVGGTVVPSGGRDGDGRVDHELARRLERGPESDRFSFSYRRGGTRVLDCALPNTAFAADVDAAGGRMVVRSAAGGNTLVIVVGQAVYLHRSLFDEPPFATTWLRAPRRLDQAGSDALRRVLGVDLAREVVGTDLPASGRAIITEALEVAGGVERIPAATVEGGTAEGFRVSVDPSRFQAAAVPPGERAGGAEEVIPVFDVWLDAAGRVVRLTVAPRRADGTAGPAEGGWTVDYRPAATVAAAAPQPSDVSEWSDVDPSGLVPTPSQCRLPA